MIVLHKIHLPPDDLIKLALIETFKEKSALIAKNPGFQKKNIGYCQLYRLHF